MRIAIIGCGPAGLCAAIALHDRQFDITVYEKFEEPGPVGSGLMLQPTGLAVLDTLGLRQAAERLGQRIDGMLGRLAPNGKTVLDIQYRVLNKDLFGVAIHRASLFQILFDAVMTRGIQIRADHTITSVDQSHRNQIRLVSHNETLPEDFDLVVDASGANSAVLQSTFPALKQTNLSFGALWTTVPVNNFSATVLEQRYVKASKMIGLLPCGTMPKQNKKLATLFYSIENENYENWMQRGLDPWKREVKKLWPETASLLDSIKSTEHLTFTQYKHHTLKVPVNGRLVFIGDTAHATSPQLGQGANMAFLDAMALANALTIHRSNAEKGCQLYARTRRNHVRLYQSISYLLTPFYQSNSSVLPFMRDQFFEPVTSIGIMNRFITKLGAGMLVDPSTGLTNSYDKLNKAQQ